MKVREFVQDAPELRSLLGRCESNTYGIDVFDLFYLQSLSERNKIRFKGFNPNDGHWYGPSVAAYWGMLQGGMKENGISQKVLDLSKQFVEQMMRSELQAPEGIFMRPSSDEIKSTLQLGSELNGELRKIGEPYFGIFREVERSYRVVVKQFPFICNRKDPVVLENVDFNSIVFDRTQIFLPWKEGRAYTENEATRLDLMHLHDLYPVTSHLFYFNVKSNI